jgi:alkanesulfonate monooxygenase SsuD/methylene tetrahydromethanopterin reductase-like flavin-dependent oxidoreductase (luciferase family)
MAGESPAEERRHDLHFGIVVGQHYRDWPELVEQFQWADESGWDSAWGFDHFFSLRDGNEMGPCLEGWTLLGAMAALTSRVQLGLMVTGITHRHPSVLFKQAVTVDHVSGGRCILGVGAAWNEREHRAYGIPFPPPRERVDMFGEAMEMLRLLETQARATFTGDHYQLEDAPFEPKPVNGHLPVLVGSTGRRMMRHVARYADLWDGGGTPEQFSARGARLNELCREIGREPGEIRWAYQHAPAGLTSVDAFKEHVHAYAAAGVSVFLIDVPRGSPTPVQRAIAEQVIPELREWHAANPASRT